MTETSTPEQRARLLDFVRALEVEQPDPATAGERLRALRAELPHLRIELVPETENVGGSRTYALLVTDGTLVWSLSCSRSDTLPWQLRGATNADANELLTVDGYRMSFESAVTLLDVLWERTDLATRLVDAALFAREAEALDSGREPDPSALLARFYADRGLDDEAARARWLAGRGLEESALAVLLCDVVVKREVEQALVGERVAAERAAAPDYAAIRVLRMVLPPELRAEAERLLPDTPALSSLVAALARQDGFRQALPIECCELLRHEVAAVDRERLFAALPGAVLAVAAAEGGDWLVEVVEPGDRPEGAELDRRIVRRLMQDWYRQRRAQARIDWHWGRGD